MTRYNKVNGFMTAVPRQPLMEARSDDTRDGRSFYPSNIVRTNRIRTIFDRAFTPGLLAVTEARSIKKRSVDIRVSI